MGLWQKSSSLLISTPDFKKNLMISIKGLAKKYDSLLAVDGIDLEIPKGELFGFLGLNGAGKTTTIKLLVGLLKPTSGSIFIDGIDVGRNPIEVKIYRLYS
jgi:ABC-2 type transport system ATP-binding protein